VQTRIVRIGNSQGIRIPKPLLEAAGLQGAVELTSRRGELLIRPARRRAGWAEAFQKMAQRGDDTLPADIPRTPSDWDEEEWEWQ
jgi:antitoxin MazE